MAYKSRFKFVSLDLNLLSTDVVLAFRSDIINIDCSNFNFVILIRIVGGLPTPIHQVKTTVLTQLREGKVPIMRCIILFLYISLPDHDGVLSTGSLLIPARLQILLGFNFRAIFLFVLLDSVWYGIIVQRKLLIVPLPWPLVAGIILHGPKLSIFVCRHLLHHLECLLVNTSELPVLRIPSLRICVDEARKRFDLLQHHRILSRLQDILRVLSVVESGIWVRYRVEFLLFQKWLLLLVWESVVWTDLLWY